MAKNIPANQWRVTWWVRLNIYDVELLLAVVCGAAGIFLNKNHDTT